MTDFHLMFVSSGNSRLSYANDLAVIQQLPEALSQIKTLTIANSSDEALHICEDNPPDLVIVDSWVLPLDTMKVTHKIREMLPKTIIVTLSSSLSADWLRASIEAGANEILSKPLRLEELVGYIPMALDGTNTA